MKYMIKIALVLSLGYGISFSKNIDGYEFSDFCMEASGKEILYTLKSSLEKDKALAIIYLDIVIEAKMDMISECPMEFFIENGRDFKKELKQLYEVKAHYENR